MAHPLHKCSITQCAYFDIKHAAPGVKQLASDSLELLREFLYDDRFPALFDLELYGSIIGMFELNNLSTPLLPTCSCRMLKCGLSAVADTRDSQSLSARLDVMIVTHPIDLC